MRHTSRNRGFTLLEVLIMSGVALILLGVGWFVFFSATNQSRKLDTRLRAIQASQLLTERIKTDLKGFYYIPSYYMVEASPPRLSFRMFRDYVYSRTERSQASVVLESINYTFDRDLHLVRRNNEQLTACRFESVSFSLKESTAGTAPELSNAVTIHTVYVPDELLNTPERITDKDRVHWMAVIGLPHRSLIEASPFWLDNPFDRPATY